MKSRVFAGTALALAGSLVLAACGGGGGTSATGGGTSAASDDGGPTGDGEKYQVGISLFVTHPSLDAARDGFKKALEDAGLDVTYDEQNAQADVGTAATIAGNFAAAGLDLVLAIATPSAQAAVQAITDKPVLFTAVTDPVDAGLVDSVEAPGANVTGTSDKNPVKEQLELLKEIAPDATSVGIVYSSGEANSIIQVDWAKEAASELGLTIEEATVSEAKDIQQAAESLNVDAYYVPTDNLVVSALGSLLQVAETRKIPVIAAEGDSVAAGAVATVGLSYFDLGYQTGQMAVRILTEGADPATMAVEYQQDLETYVNLDAAARMDVTIPESVLDAAKPENVTE